MLVNYRAPVQTPNGRPYPTYEARHLLVSQDQLLAGQKPLVDPAVFKNKIVFIGLTGAGLVDVFQTPMGGGLMPGIQLHASVADSLLANRFISVAPASWRVVVDGQRRNSRRADGGAAAVRGRRRQVR